KIAANSTVPITIGRSRWRIAFHASPPMPGMPNTDSVSTAPPIRYAMSMPSMDIAYLMGGAVLTESVFGIPGIGGLAWKAIRQRDLPMVMGTVLFAAIF